MITTSDFSKGTRFLLKDEPYQIVDITTQSPSARGASTLVKVKARNLLTGKLVAETFKSGTKFEEPDLKIASVQYLYSEGEAAVFMDQENYDQFSLPLENLGEQAVLLDSELKLKAMYFNDNPVNVEFPMHVEAEIDTVEPGAKGNTASGSVTTKAITTKGLEIQVPLNIKDGDKILIDSASLSFYGRA